MAANVPAPGCADPGEVSQAGKGSLRWRRGGSAIIEPCYDIDGYDYAGDGNTAWLVLLDAMGRGWAACRRLQPSA
jgi:hypothetical protein